MYYGRTTHRKSGNALHAYRTCNTVHTSCLQMWAHSTNSCIPLRCASTRIWSWSNTRRSKRVHVYTCTYTHYRHLICTHVSVYTCSCDHNLRTTSPYFPTRTWAHSRFCTCAATMRGLDSCMGIGTAESPKGLVRLVHQLLSSVVYDGS